MKAPLTCEGCSRRLDSIINPEDDPPRYNWIEEHNRYVLVHEGTAHMECPWCGRNLQSDYEFDVPDSYVYEAPLPLWRGNFDGLPDDDTIVVEAETEEEALATLKWLHPSEVNYKVTPTDKHFPD